MKIFSVECISDVQAFARIKRFDEKFYNPSTKKFEDGFKTKIKLVKVEDNIWKMESEIQIDPVQFLTGQYVVYYYDASKLCGAIYQDVDNNEVLTSTGIASRVANIQTADGTLRKTLDKLSRRDDEILTTLKEILVILKAK